MTHTTRNFPCLPGRGSTCNTNNMIPVLYDNMTHTTYLKHPMPSRQGEHLQGASVPPLLQQHLLEAVSTCLDEPQAVQVRGD